jgi:hypothetical protein
MFPFGNRQSENCWEGAVLGLRLLEGAREVDAAASLDVSGYIEEFDARLVL